MILNKKFMSMTLLGIFLFFSLSTALNTNAVAYVPKDRPVVLIDLAHTTYPENFDKLQSILPTWGFDVVTWTTGNWSATTFTGIDIVVVPALSYNLTSSEISLAKAWFDSGNKAIWVAGDSDFGGNAAWAYRANDLLTVLGSSIYIESGAVESDINFKATYRVSATVYNTNDSNAKFITSQFPYQGTAAMASFHGPTAVIGKNSTGDYVPLETTTLPNVEWVVKAKNATFLPNTNITEAGGAQVHTNNQEGEFVLMALQYGAGIAQTSKIVVTGEAPFSTYKSMFNDPGEYEIPQNDFYMVYNTFMWFNMQGYLTDTATLPMVMIDFAHAAYNYNYDKFADHLLSWGYNVTKFMTGNLTDSDFTGVDVFIVPALQYNYTAAELTALAKWFASGQKSIWVAGDSDFGGDASWSYRANDVLSAVNSSIYVESGAVESDINFKATYRVSAPLYNYNGTNAWDLVNGLPYQGADAMASFHGPTAVIGKNSTGDYVPLETTTLPNVEWVVQATNGTFLPNTNITEAGGAQVHTNNQEGDFVMMALQVNAGDAGTSKIVVSGENIFSTYKSMFNDPGEYDIPQNDYYIVYNTIQWFVTRQVNTRPVVMVDISDTSYPENYDAVINALQEWGYQSILNNDTLSASILSGVDVLYVAQRSVNYSASEITALKDWFGGGNKGLWMTGDSDFGGNANWSISANDALSAVNSSIYVESGAVESDINFKATYRVSATDYNTTGPNSKYIVGRLPLTGSDAMAAFHGPAAVIGKNSTGDYVALETNYLQNVEWVVKAKNATFLPNTNVTEALGAQVHTNNQEGEFVMMALQTNAGYAGTSKIVVTGESIASSYKNMFNPIGEYEIPHNDYFIDFNTFQWFATIHLRPVIPAVHLLTPENNFKTAGPVTLTWMVPQFHAATFKFDVFVNDSIVETTVGNTVTLDLSTGAHEIFVKEESLQGFVGRSLTVLVYVDVDAPVVTITSPTANAELTATSVKVDWTATDVGQGLKSFEVLVDGTSKTNITTISTTTYTTTTLSVGQHNIQVKATDNLGNVGQANVTITIKQQTTTTSSSSSTTTTSKSKNSPGFEFIFLLGALALVFAYRKKRSY